MFYLYDPETKSILSAHKTLKSTIEADIKFQRKLEKQGGDGSYPSLQYLQDVGKKVIANQIAKSRVIKTWRQI